MSDVVSLSKALMQLPSVTPGGKNCLDIIIPRLEKLGFTLERFPVGDDLARDPLVGVFSDVAAWRRAGPEQGRDLVITGAAIEEPGGGSAFFCELFQNFLAAQYSGPVRWIGKVLEIRDVRHETIRLVHKSGDSDAGHSLILLQVRGDYRGPTEPAQSFQAGRPA